MSSSIYIDPLAPKLVPNIQQLLTNWTYLLKIFTTNIFVGPSDVEAALDPEGAGPDVRSVHGLNYKIFSLKGKFGDIFKNLSN